MLPFSWMAGPFAWAYSRSTRINGWWHVAFKLHVRRPGKVYAE